MGSVLLVYVSFFKNKYHMVIADHPWFHYIWIWSSTCSLCEKEAVYIYAYKRQYLESGNRILKVVATLSWTKWQHCYETKLQHFFEQNGNFDVILLQDKMATLVWTKSQVSKKNITVYEIYMFWNTMYIYKINVILVHFFNWVAFCQKFIHIQLEIPLSPKILQKQR